MFCFWVLRLLTGLKYLNNKAGYVDGIEKIINWAVAEERYKKGTEAPSLKL